MKWKTLVIGWALALTLLLFAQRKNSLPEQTMYRAVIDLSHAVSEDAPNWDGKPSSLKTRTLLTHERDGFYAREITFDEHVSTHIDAPAHVLNGMWTVDQIPPERLVRPLVVLDVSERAANNPGYLVDVSDIARWEEAHGTLPQESVVIAYTGWDRRWHSQKEFRNPDAKGTMHFPGFSLEAAKFLVDARNIVGLGIDSMSVDAGNSNDFPVHYYCAEHSVYHLESVANLETVPAAGATVVVSPMKLDKGSGAPVRILALVK